MTSRVLDVCAAVVVADDGRLLLATRRPGSHLAGKWEFPGGKVHPGESLEDCMRREAAEELGLLLTAARPVLAFDYAYPDRTVRLHFMWCDMAAGSAPTAREGQQIGWFSAAEVVAGLELAPADQAMLQALADSTLPDKPAPGLQAVAPALVQRLRGWLASGQETERVTASLPDWLRVPFSGGRERLQMRALLRDSHLHTVCESAKCPNLCDCWKRRTATFMLLGDTCTRNCRFCAVNHGRPPEPDPLEPERVAEGIAVLGLRFAVLTCVTRDDLPDGGAEHMAATVKAIRQRCPETRVEVLCSDYGGNLAGVDAVLASLPAVFGHNLETVSRLTPVIRSHANYERSLAVLRHAARRAPAGTKVKSGLMLGLGEEPEEVRQALRDLKQAGVSMVTMGQYLRPTREHWPVARMVTPKEFEAWRAFAENELGFGRAVCGPLVRSSYMAEEAFEASSAPEKAAP
ncbi:MAG: lipoyl synthase [Lentisphaeria bacterium]|nr:lipoyl synthase [Lentisphaeria bacterium]